MRWTKEEIAKLKKLAALKMSAYDIAEAMNGRTRNSIIGACHTYKIKLWLGPANGGPRNRRKAKRQQAAPKAVSPKCLQANAKPVAKKRNIMSFGYSKVKAACMWHGCLEQSVERGKPYCPTHTAISKNLPFRQAG